MQIRSLHNQNMMMNNYLSANKIQFSEKFKMCRSSKTDIEIVKLIDGYLRYNIGENQFDYEFSLYLNKAKDRKEKLPTWLESLKDTYKKVNDLASIEDDECISTRDFQNVLIETMANLQKNDRYKKYMSENYSKYHR